MNYNSVYIHNCFFTEMKLKLSRILHIWDVQNNLVDSCFLHHVAGSCSEKSGRFWNDLEDSEGIGNTYIHMKYGQSWKNLHLINNPRMSWQIHALNHDQTMNPTDSFISQIPSTYINLDEHGRNQFSISFLGINFENYFFEYFLKTYDNV